MKAATFGPARREVVRADEISPQAWRNGGGQTRELLAWPDTANWQLRISRADIAADGPFSSFAGVSRWFAVLRGAGVALAFADGTREVRLGDAPLPFDGASAPGCRLLDGATQDLNLMARGGTAIMLAARAATPWQSDWPLRALYTTQAGRWQAGDDSADLVANSLFWMAADAGAGWVFTPHAQGAGEGAWWMGFRPAN